MVLPLPSVVVACSVEHGSPGPGWDVAARAGPVKPSAAIARADPIVRAISVGRRVLIVITARRRFRLYFRVVLRSDGRILDDCSAR